jgi:glucokinase
MYVGIDVGGTKTLAAALNNEGVIVEQEKFPTPKKYDAFLVKLEQTLSHFEHHDFKAGGAGLPGTLDRKHGQIISMGNLPWKDVPILHDLEKLANCPFVIENDAKMAGLSEAMLLKDKFTKVLYVTVSTGIGYAVIDNQRIDTNIGDAGGKNILLEYRGKLMPWEEFASGKALAERYGKRASDITDEKTWRIICRYIAQGLIELIAVIEPEVIVIGGGVGSYFERYGKILEKELHKYKLPTTTLPKLMGAQRAEEAVVYGCYDLAKQVYAHD